MPAKFSRLNKRQTESCRQAIQTTLIINRLTDFVNGKEGVDMSPSQVTAALGLLKKTLPDLKAVEHTGEDGGPIKYDRVVIEYATPALPAQDSADS